MSSWLSEVEAQIRSLKSGGIERLQASSEIRLRPIGTTPSPQDAQRLAQWRNQQPRAFFTWLTSTEASTERWLSRVYGPASRDLLVMLEDDQGVPFGHLALIAFSEHPQLGRSCELARVLRGTSGGPRGAMTRSIELLVAWAAEVLGVESVTLEVFADNAPAIACYERCGFVLTERWGLTRDEGPEMVRWSRASSGGAVDAWAVTMVHTLASH